MKIGSMFIKSSLNRHFKKHKTLLINLLTGLKSTRGGNRTRTPKNWILNPARLPVPPLEQICRLKTTSCENKTAKLNNYFLSITKNIKIYTLATKFNF